jgi:pheromone shutdown protein TraB
MVANARRRIENLTTEQVAAEVGSKRETVTNAFTLRQRAGAVELKRRRIHVKDIEALKSAARQEPLPKIKDKLAGR